MDNTSMTKARVVMMVGIWLTILTVIVFAWKYWWAPRQEKKAEEQAVQEHQQTIEKTSTQSRYTYETRFNLDAFSGYAVFRSSDFKRECGKFGIKVDLVDDRANYPDRLKALADGQCDMAVFTIDALIKASTKLGDLPAAIVAVVDETKGADAAVVAKKRFPNIDALNTPETRFVCTPDSPSETMARVIMAYFQLDNLSTSPFIFVDGADKVYEMYKKSKPGDPYVFILWEPYVSKMVENPDYGTLVDSSKFRGYIVDVIVARRPFLVKNEEIAERVVKSYLTTVFNYRTGMSALVADDAKSLGAPLKPEQAERLAQTIWWKNTQENFAHFGIASGHNLQHLEEICANITQVLLKTKAIDKDPTNGQPNLLFYDGIMRKLFDSSWHPGFGQEGVRTETSLNALSDQEWATLKPVGTLQVPRLVFGRGTAQLTELSAQTLEELAGKLKTWPQYYLVVRGNCSKEGDVEANKKLAEERAKAAVEQLIAKGIDEKRIRAETSAPNGSTTVAFILGELPY